MIERAFQIIDRPQQILDEILVPVHQGLLALLEAAATEVVELGLEASVTVRRSSTSLPRLSNSSFID